MSQEVANLLRTIREVGERDDRISAGPNATGLCMRSLPAEVRAGFLKNWRKNPEVAVFLMGYEVSSFYSCLQ